MKRRAFCLVLLFSLLLCSCAAPRGDFFEIFKGSYTARLDGRIHELDFSADLRVEKGEDGGVSPATVTFYAPNELAGTVIARAADGTVTIKVGDLAIADTGGVGAALFSLFPTSAAITDTGVSDEGHTVVSFEGGELTFLPDGTPYKIKTPDVSATVVEFKGGRK